MDPQSSSELQTPREDTSNSDSLEAIRSGLRAFTSARVSLTRTGVSITTRDTLAFALDHAQARDAVYATLSLPTMIADLNARGLPTVAVKSAATDRKTYLRRPDLGRTLSEASLATLAALVESTPGPGDHPLPRLTIVLADGLSALATDRHALAVVNSLLPLIGTDWALTEVVVAEQARVALGDEIGVALKAQMTLVLIGERPGLLAADSLGAYITWAPRAGRTNAERNCISNIRGGGLTPLEAAQRIAFYLREAKRLRLTGTMLKDPDSVPSLLPGQAQ